MKVLDGDDVRLSAKGRYAERDIVQVGCVLLAVRFWGLNLKTRLGALFCDLQLRLKPINDER